MASIYGGIWEKLKAEKKVAVRFNVVSPNKEEMKRKFKRVQRAISNVKVSDYDFLLRNPHSRLVVTNRNYVEGVLELELHYTDLPTVLDID